MELKNVKHSYGLTLLTLMAPKFCQSIALLHLQSVKTRREIGPLRIAEIGGSSSEGVRG
jgi:hypothetical protein